MMTASRLPELTALERLIEQGGARIQASVACTVSSRGERYPVHVLTMGSSSPDAPVVGFFGGIHGLERIGTQVILAFLQSLLARLRWDRALQHQLEQVRLVFMPLVNPGGMAHATRCNPAGVDLMRNSPVQASENVPFLLGGQRLSHRLPWFRGDFGEPMESESLALCQVVEHELLARPFSMALDCHSGFGMRDRIWFPHAHTSTPIAHLAEVAALEALFSESYPHHNYHFEPQSRAYRTHGDLWDHLYLHAARLEARVFLPLTLEMGSWLWVKKNPRQLFSRLGMFNPTAAHRLQRVLRSHLVWFEFLLRAASAHGHWLPAEAARGEHRARALARWYKPGER